MTTPAPLNFHPLADLFPLVEGQEFAELVADIREHGLREPVVLYEGKVLDGRNRYRACCAVGIDPTFAVYQGDDPVAYVISLNLRRRHLDESQRAMVAAKLATLPRGANQHSPIGETSQARAAQLLNVGKRSVERAREVQEHGAPELVHAVEQGAVSVSAAATIADRSIEEQHQNPRAGRAETYSESSAGDQCQESRNSPC
jgi:ParB-like chromosome segregation protein Spo0J